MVVLGFHPLRSSMKYELATPLLMANILRWMAPETFRRWDVQAGTVGTVNVALDKGTDPASVRVLTENQRPLPFTIEGNCAAILRRRAGNGSRVDRRSRDGVFADAAGCGRQRRGVRRRMFAAAFRARRRLERSPPICGRGWRCWAAWACWSTGCCTDAAARFACAASKIAVNGAVRRPGEKRHDLRSHVGAGDRVAAARLDDLRMAAHRAPIARWS